TIYRISQLLPPPSLRLFSAPAAATPVLYTPSLHDALPICTTEHTQAPVAFEGDRADGGHGVLTSVFGLALLQSSTALRLQDDRCEQGAHGVGVHALSRYRDRDEDIQQGAALGRSCRHEHEVACGGVVKAAVGLDPP